MWNLIFLVTKILCSTLFFRLLTNMLPNFVTSNEQIFFLFPYLDFRFYFACFPSESFKTICLTCIWSKFIDTCFCLRKAHNLCRIDLHFSQLVIAGLHMTSRRPCWWLRTKAFLSSGNLTLFSRIDHQGTTIMAALSLGRKPRIAWSKPPHEIWRSSYCCRLFAVLQDSFFNS